MRSQDQIKKMAQQAKKAALALSLVSRESKDNALRLMAEALEGNQDYLMAQNQKDLKAAGTKGYSKAMIDRLTLTPQRIHGMVESILDVVKLKDPVGEVIEVIERPNGLVIKKVRVPVGVIGIIYESRPNVTSDCVALCLKSGNAVILKGGKEALYSNKAIYTLLRDALKKTDIPLHAIGLIPSTDRGAIKHLLRQNECVDLIIPRGGEGLIRFVAENSLIPVIKHYKGVCHIYVAEHADLNMAHKVCINAKVQRPGVCNAMETMLVHKDVAQRFLPVIVHELKQKGVEIRGCSTTRKILKQGVVPATENDWREEYLDLILSVKVVNSLAEAIDHINTYGSRHSDAIITDNKKEAAIFMNAVDSACLYANASTRFTDGFEFGFGAEIGISTDKLHARGPMALAELTTYKYCIYGQGHIRQ